MHMTDGEHRICKQVQSSTLSQAGSSLRFLTSEAAPLQTAATLLMTLVSCCLAFAASKSAHLASIQASDKSATSFRHCHLLRCRANCLQSTHRQQLSSATLHAHVADSGMVLSHHCSNCRSVTTDWLQWLKCGCQFHVSIWVHALWQAVVTV